MRPIVVSNMQVIETLRKKAQEHATLAATYERAANMLSQPAEIAPKPTPETNGRPPRRLPTGKYY